MDDGNKTTQIEYRFLSAADFSALHHTFLEAFSDYPVPFQLSEAQLENHIAQNSVILEKCVGAFFGGKMVAVTLNGFGEWNGKKTVYDAGTGVIPAFRKRGIGQAIFDFMIPKFKNEGCEQILLEVISGNENAFRLYRKLGFETTRKLLFFESKRPFYFQTTGEFQVRQISEPDWNLLETMSGGKTSWQNSPKAISQTLRKTILGAFLGEKLIGYGIILIKSGIVPQIAVLKEFRRRGAALLILSEMQKLIGDEKHLRLTNIDESLTEEIDFLKRHGFIEIMSQSEMLKLL